MNGMDHGGGGGGGYMAAAPFGMRRHRKMMMHMTFFWGKNAELLFDRWPGTSVPMYALSLVFVFVMAVLVEWLNNSRLIRPGTHRAAAVLLRTLMHTVRMGLAYLVMLAVMSFNGGVFLAAMAGFGFGFFLFGARLGEKPAERDDGCKPDHGAGNTDLPPMICC